MMEVTYSLAKGPPALTVEEYLAVAKVEWSQLLRDDAEETQIQAFLERNPIYLPGALTPGNPSGHAPLHFAAISQPKLPGLSSKIPDFMWVATHSGAWFPTLIEIERPSKPIFRKDGVPTAEFTQARNQLAQWRTWFNEPENVLQFIQSYDIPDLFKKYRKMQLHMILIYGRRSEFSADPELSKHRSTLLPGADEELMSFDRLHPNPTLNDAITVRADGTRKYRAINVPPTFRLGPIYAGRLRAIEGIDDCILHTPLISEERRHFLRQRLQYWREWGGSGIISTDAWE